MATTEQLLELSTRGAIVRMINDENKTFFNGDEAGPLVISPPLVKGGIRTEVEVSIRRKLSGMDELPFAGQLAFRYNRLDVENTFYGRLNGFRPSMPTSTQVLLDELTARMGIKFEKDDFILEDIIRNNAAPYVLKAKPESLRWVGSMAIQLIDLTDLATYVPGGLPVPVQTLELAKPVLRSRDVFPYLNVTPFVGELNAIGLNEPVESASHPLSAFLRKVMPAYGAYRRGGADTWTYAAGDGVGNTRGAQLISLGEIVAGNNALLDSNVVARVRLGAGNTGLGDKDLLLPYALPNFNNSQFNGTPRLKATAVVNASNGTAWNKWLNALVAPSVITSLPAGLNLRFSGPDLWVADADNPSPTNLYNAVVQYNGSRRAYDIDGYYAECNRALVVTISDKNTAYQGNLTFHYRAPIIINEKLPDGELGTAYNFALNPREGVAPYTFTRISGVFAPEHTLTADHRIAGDSTQTGTYQSVYDVKDAAGTVVRYTLFYRVIVGLMRIAGVPPVATRGTPYEFTFEVAGGVPAYTYRLINNSGGSELSLPSPFNPRVAGTFTGAAGTRSFALEVTDQQGSVATYSFTITVN